MSSSQPSMPPSPRPGPCSFSGLGCITEESGITGVQRHGTVLCLKCLEVHPRILEEKARDSSNPDLMAMLTEHLKDKAQQYLREKKYKYLCASQDPDLATDANKVWRNALKPGEKDCEPVERQYQLCESCMPNAEAGISADYKKFFNLKNGFWKFDCAMLDPDYEDEEVYRWRDISKLKEFRHKTPTLQKGRLCQKCFNYVFKYGGNLKPPKDGPPTLASRVELYFDAKYEPEEDQEVYDLKHKTISREE